MEDEERYTRRERAHQVGAGPEPRRSDGAPFPILGEATLAADDPPASDRSVDPLGQNHEASLGQKHCSLERSERGPGTHHATAGPLTPELRSRNRQQRDLRPDVEDGSTAGNPRKVKEVFSSYGTGHIMDEEEDITPDHREYTPEATGCTGEEPLLRELSAKVQAIVRSSSWWEKHGFDCSIITMAFLVLPAGFLCLQSDNALLFLIGILTLGLAYSTVTVKGSHLASHGTLLESKRWSKIWAAFFIEVCSAFPTEVGAYSHVKLHHAHTNIIGLGDSSVWKIPALNRFVYMFLAPLALPILTPLVALSFLKEMSLYRAARMLCLISLGLGGHYWLLLNVSGFQSLWSAVLCMFLTRAVLALPFVHVNIFQHIGLAMFAAEDRPKRILQMSHGVLNLPRNFLLDWTFGHSLISCHVEHHLFPNLSDNMCLKIKPIVSQYLLDKNLPYHEQSYLSRLQLFLVRYEDLMVHMPPITQLVGIQ